MPLLSELFQIPEDELLKKLEFYNPNAYRALHFLFFFDLSNQEAARCGVITFYKQLLSAILSKDKVEQLRLVHKISDMEASRVANRRKSGDILTDEDAKVIMQYQLKYAMSYQVTSDLFNIHKSSLHRKVQKIIAEDDSLKEKYERLKDYDEIAWDKKRK